jgi:hypothetical protein
MSWLGNFGKIVEQDVLLVVAKIKLGVEFAEHEIQAGLDWLTKHSTQIVDAIKMVEGVVASLSGAGVKIPPQVFEAVKDANIAVAGMNAMVSSAEKGTPQALVDGYVAAKAAWTAADKASLAIANVQNPNA